MADEKDVFYEVGIQMRRRGASRDVSSINPGRLLSKWCQLIVYSG
jgi:hypothetical protein